MSTLSHPIPLPQTSTHLPMIPTPLDWFYPTQTRHLRHMKSLPQLISQALTSFHPPQYPAMGETSMESYVQCAFFHTYAHTEDNIKVTELSIPHTLVLLTLHKAPPKRRHLQTRTQHRPHPTPTTGHRRRDVVCWTIPTHRHHALPPGPNTAIHSHPYGFLPPGFLLGTLRSRPDFLRVGNYAPGRGRALSGLTASRKRL